MVGDRKGVLARNWSLCLPIAVVSIFKPHSGKNIPPTPKWGQKPTHCFLLCPTITEAHGWKKTESPVSRSCWGKWNTLLYGTPTYANSQRKPSMFSRNPSKQHKRTRKLFSPVHFLLAEWCGWSPSRHLPTAPLLMSNLRTPCPRIWQTHRQNDVKETLLPTGLRILSGHKRTL